MLETARLPKEFCPNSHKHGGILSVMELQKKLDLNNDECGRCLRCRCKRFIKNPLLINSGHAVFFMNDSKSHICAACDIPKLCRGSIAYHMQ